MVLTPVHPPPSFFLNLASHERTPHLHPQQRGYLPKVRCPRYAKSIPSTTLNRAKLTCLNPDRNRLPSLYSDFALQKKTNPDGYAVNVAAWEQALNHAAKRGYTSSRGVRVRSGSSASQKNAAPSRKKTDHLILRTDESLLRDLELPELGRPVALGAVFVCLCKVRIFEGGSMANAGCRWKQ